MCYVLVYEVGEGTPIPFWLVVFSIKTCNEIKHATFTMKYDKKHKRYKKINHFDAAASLVHKNEINKT